MKATEWLTSVDLAEATFADLLGLQLALTATWKAKARWAYERNRDLGGMIDRLAALSEESADACSAVIAEMRAHAAQQW